MIDGGDQDLEELLAEALFGDDLMEITRLLNLLGDRKLTIPILAVDNSKMHS